MKWWMSRKRYEGVDKTARSIDDPTCSTLVTSARVLEKPSVIRIGAPSARGDKVVPEKKVLEVVVEKGMQNGQKTTFAGEADEAPETVTGDIMFVLQQKFHPKCKRKGQDLFYEHTLSLTEALRCFRFDLTHLNRRQLQIKSV